LPEPIGTGKGGERSGVEQSERRETRATSEKTITSSSGIYGGSIVDHLGGYQQRSGKSGLKRAIPYSTVT
jgi:hypothetical protein